MRTLFLIIRFLTVWKNITKRNSFCFQFGLRTINVCRPFMTIVKGMAEQVDRYKETIRLSSRIWYNLIYKDLGAKLDVTEQHSIIYCNRLLRSSSSCVTISI